MGKVAELKKLLEVAGTEVAEPGEIQASTMTRFNHFYEMTWKSDVQFLRNMRLFLKYLKGRGLRVNYDYIIKIDNSFLQDKLVLLLRRGLSDKRVQDITSKTQFALVKKEIAPEVAPEEAPEEEEGNE